MLMQATRRSGQGNQCLEVICLPQVRESLEAVAQVRELLNRKYEENALIVVRLVIWLKSVGQHRHVLDVEKWVTPVGTVNSPQDVSTVEKLGIPLETVFIPRY